MILLINKLKNRIDIIIKLNNNSYIDCNLKIRFKKKKIKNQLKYRQNRNIFQIDKISLIFMISNRNNRKQKGRYIYNKFL